MIFESLFVMILKDLWDQNNFLLLLISHCLKELFVTKRRAISGVAEENIVAVGRISGSPVE